MSWDLPVVLWATCGLGICLAITGQTLGSSKVDCSIDSVLKTFSTTTSIVLQWTGDGCKEFSATLNNNNTHENASCAEDGKTGNISFSDLSPGVLYVVTLFNVSTQVCNSSIRTFPATVQGLNCTPNEDDSTTALDVRWEPADGDSTLYTIMYTAKDNTTDTKCTNTTSENITFYNLTRGRIYNISVFTISVDLQSQDPAITTGQTVPATVQGLNCTPNEDHSTTALDVRWDPADGDSTLYTIMYTAKYNTTDTKCTNTTSENITFYNLTPGRIYNISVFTISGDLQSQDPANTTGQTVPATVQGLNCTPNEDDSTTALDVRWDPADGDSTLYTIMYTAKYNTTDTKCTNTTSENITFYNLTRGRIYNISVFTISEDLQSQDPANTTGQTVPATVQGLNCTPNEDDSTTALDVRWDPADGDSTLYTIMYTAKDNTTDTMCTNTTSENITFYNLTRGRIYNISVFTISEDLQSQDPANITGQTVPATVGGLECTPNENNSTTALDVRWEAAEGDSTRYKIMYTAKHDTKWTNTTSEYITLYNLTPGRIYNISVFTISEDLQSQDPANTAGQTVPATVRGLKCTPNEDNNTTALDVRWEAAKGDSTFYKIMYTAKDDTTDTKCMNTSENITFYNLTPGRIYNISVFTISVDLKSQDPANTTGQTVPSTVRGLYCTPNEDDSTTALDVRWDPAEGDSTRYQIMYTAKDNPTDTKCTNRTSENITFSHLTPGRIYNISVFTISGDLKNQDPANTAGQTVPATVRGLKCTPNEDNNTTALDVRWEAAKGDSTFYKIMYMAKDDTTDTKCMNIRSENTTFYNLTPGRIYNISVFTISVDLKNQDPANTTGQTEPADVSSVKVAGYGKQAVIVKWDAAIGDVDVYFVDLYAGDKMIRSTTAAYTASSHEVIFYDLKYDFLYDAMVKTCSYALNSTGKCGSGHSPIHVDLIVGLTVFFLLAAIIIATGGFLIKKCRIKKQDEITRDFSLRCQNLPISLSQFDDHYHNLEANSELGFSEEFAKLQDVGRCEIISVARLPENRERNRYTNILPYDVTRVILSSEVGKSDYINASFIPGKSSPREYIASQGPMMGTLVDFWHMVWELGVSNIIMLTKCVENGKLKCERYWPMDEEPLCFGDINVTCFSEEKHSKDWIIRKMQIQHVRKHVCCTHFLTWKWFSASLPSYST
uniref:receptor-type tyrosine-protein phosphatase beta-like isoform X3 n=1 Tax=Myxine glutinosa TaxID=7769 RepID=UPI00358FD692